MTDGTHKGHGPFLPWRSNAIEIINSRRGTLGFRKRLRLPKLLSSHSARTQ